MKYRTFVIYNVIGGVLWTTSMLSLGALLGKTFPGIGERLDYVIVVIVVLSLIPFAIEYVRHRRRGARGRRRRRGRRERVRGRRDG